MSSLVLDLKYIYLIINIFFPMYISYSPYVELPREDITTHF